jgi:hypothetical protein
MQAEMTRVASWHHMASGNLRWRAPRRIRYSAAELSVRTVTSAANVVFNRPTVKAGPARVDVRWRFADDLIAYEGNWLARRRPSHSIRRR